MPAAESRTTTIKAAFIPGILFGGSAFWPAFESKLRVAASRPE
jgi:hypothetical protein